MQIDYAATHANAVAALNRMSRDERFGERGSRMEIHAANFLDQAEGRLSEFDDYNPFMRESEAFFRALGMLVERP